MKALLLLAFLSVGIVSAEAAEVCGFLYHDRMSDSYVLQDYVKNCYYNIQPGALSASVNSSLKKQTKSAQDMRATATTCLLATTKGDPCKDAQASITSVERILYLGYEH